MYNTRLCGITLRDCLCERHHCQGSLNGIKQCVALVSDWEKIGKVRIAAALSVWIGSPLEIREIGSKSVLEFSRKVQLQYAR